MAPEPLFHIGIVILGIGMAIAVVNSVVANIRRMAGANREAVSRDLNRVLILVIAFVALGGALMAVGKALS